jgi:hypothetical protein
MVKNGSSRRGCSTMRYVVSAALLVSLAACTSSRSNSASTSVSSGKRTPVTAAPGATESPATNAAPATTGAEAPTTVEQTTTTTIPPTTTTTVALVTDGAIVLVANATAVPGGAGRLTKELAAAGFQTAKATDAGGDEEMLALTKVYFLPAGEAVATSLARALGVPLARMPTPAPITDATLGLGDATVLVMLGKDLAGTTPAGLPRG